MRQVRTINRGLTRPETVAGAEKMPLGLAVTGAVLFGMLAWWFWSLVALAVALVLLFVGVPVLRRMGKADPMMVSVYRANLALRDYYPARSAAHVREAAPKTSQAGNVATSALVALVAGWAVGWPILYWLGAGLGVLALIVHFAAKRTAPAAAES